MPSKVPDQLVNAFVEAAGGQLQRLTEAIGSTVSLTPQVYGDSATPVGNNVRSTPAQSSSQAQQSGSANAVESAVTTFFESGFGMAALVKGLFGIFGGGDSSTPPPLERYEMPSPILFASAETPSAGLAAVDYDQFGQPRAIAASQPATPAAHTAAPAEAVAPQITVNVQTMDAQSFLDHSSQIAQAVRGAMLNMSSINDVVNEL